MRIRAYSITILLAIMSLTAISSGQSNSGDVPWVDATEDSDGGSIAVLSILVDNHSSFSSSVSDAPILIEVYTATWCETCIPAEDALDSETSELDVEIIKFHRHLFEVEATTTQRDDGLVDTDPPLPLLNNPLEHPQR